RAGWRARPGLAGPAALTQDPGLEQGGLAGVAVDVAPAVASGQDAVRARLIVAVIVAPALLVRVCELAVELGGQLVLLVVGVAVDSLDFDDHAHLVPGPGQAVPARQLCGGAGNVVIHARMVACATDISM